MMSTGGEVHATNTVFMLVSTSENWDLTGHGTPRISPQLSLQIHCHLFMDC